MKNNSRNIQEIFGIVEEKKIDPIRLSFQHKLMRSDLNYSSKKPRISRNLTTKELRKNFLKNRESISPKKKESSIFRNKILEYKNLAMNRNKFPSISTNNSIHLTYQEMPKYFNNNYEINSLKQKGTTFLNKQKKIKNNNILDSYNEKLMPVLYTERKETKKSINKNEISALPKTKKTTKKTIKFFPEEIKSILMENNSRNKNEDFGNDDEKGKIQNKLAFQHKSNLSNFYKPNKKQKSRINISTNKLNEKLFQKSSNNFNIPNNYLEYKMCYTDKNKKGSISTKNYFKYNNNLNTINNLKLEKIPKKNKNFFREKSDIQKTDITNSFNRSITYELNDCNKAPIKIKANLKELRNNLFATKATNELEKKNKEFEEEINKLKKELEDKDKIIKKQNIKIKELENTIKETKINNNKDIEKLLDEIKKIKSIIPFDILPGEKIMSIIFKSDDQNILYSVVCKSTDKMIRLKNIIYDKYPEYKEYENDFLFKGEKINENKTLEDNKIKDGSIITIYNNYN